MSSSSTSRPVFRLHLAYPDASYTRNDLPGAVRLGEIDGPAFVDGLERLADAIHETNGRLTVFLPEHEVFRDRLPLMARTPWTRRRAARRIAARALVTELGDTVLVMGRRGSDGQTPLAAVRRETLKEVRERLAGAGLRADTIRGEGRFDGFPAPPDLLAPRRAPGLWPTAWRTSERLPRFSVAAGGLAAAAALGLALLAEPAPPPVTSPGPLVHQSVARQQTEVAELKASTAPVVSKPAPAGEVSPTVKPGTAAAELAVPQGARQTAPAPDVAAVTGVSPAPDVSTRVADDTPPPAAAIAQMLRGLPEAPTLGHPDTLASAPEPQAVGPSAAIATAPGSAAPAEPALAKPALADVPSPRPRPDPAPSAAERPTAVAAATAPSMRPLPRPVAHAEPLAEAVKRVAAADTEDFVRPEHRPEQEPPVKVASLTPGAAMIGTLAAAVAAAPPQRPEDLRTGSTVPVTIAAAAAPEPKIVPATPIPKITREARAAADRARRASPSAGTSRAGLSREQLLLIGVFGETDRPHALVRLPSGDIERVRTGDNLAGYRVASVSSDGVRMRSGATEAVLRMPD